MASIQDTLAREGIVLPKAAAPVANYVPVAITGNIAIISGQLPMENGALAVTGKLGAGVSIEDGQRAARICLINALAQIEANVPGGLARVKRIVRLGGFVAAAPDFTDHAKVINGASDLAVALFGEAGKHARAAVGVASLPLDAAVEVEAMVELAELPR